eukprot:4617593-Alexandrium_andersonii.AAC.1
MPGSRGVYALANRCRRVGVRGHRGARLCVCCVTSGRSGFSVGHGRRGHAHACVGVHGSGEASMGVPGRALAWLGVRWCAWSVRGY